MGDNGKSEVNYIVDKEFKIMKKTDVIDSIKKNLIFYTAFLENNKLRVGKEILVYGKDKYIRTDTNNKEENNLENLED